MVGGGKEKLMKRLSSGIRKIIYVVIAFLLSMLSLCFIVMSNVNANGIEYTTVGGTWEQVDENTWTMDKDEDGVVDITLIKNGDEWQYLFSVSDTDAEYYAWEEVVPDGYEVEGDGTRENPLIFKKNGIITNKVIEEITPVPVGGFTLKKEITNVKDDTSKLFRFNVTLSSDDETLANLLAGTKTFGDVTFKDGVGVVYLQHGQSVSVNNVPVGIAWSVTESEADGYETKWSGSTVLDNQNGCQGTIVEDTETAIVCSNTRIDESVSPPEEEQEVSSLIVEKSVVSTSETTDKFSFHAVFFNLSHNTEYRYQKTDASDKTFVSDDMGMADVTFTLSDNESLIFSELPVGCQYQILESASDYVASYEILNGVTMVQQKFENVDVNTSLSTAKETLDAKEEATVRFTNKEPEKTSSNTDTISVYVKKVWDDADDSESIRPDSITVHLLQDDDVIATAKLDEVSNWETTFTDLDKYATDGVTEYQYSIQEVSVPGYATNVVKTTEINDETEWVQFVITNTLMNVGDLKVSKTVEGNGADKEKEFRFDITLSKNGVPVTGTYQLDSTEGTKTGTIAFNASGEASFKLKDGESIVIKNLPFDAEYQIEETSYKNYTSSDSGLYTGTITAGTMETVSVVNVFDMPYQDLSVSKVVKGNMGDKSRDFEFKIMLTKSDFAELPSTVSYTKGSETGDAVLSEDGSYVFTLAHGETITFHDIPYMTDYEVVELDGESNGYKVVAEAASGKIGEDDKDVLFINTKNAGIQTDADTNIKIILFVIACVGCAWLFVRMLFRKKKGN